MRRCVSLLQYVGWDDPARLAVLTERQFRSVLAQVRIFFMPWLPYSLLADARASRFESRS